MIYVRWKAGEPRRVRVFPPLDPDHPSVTDPCPACGLPIGHQRPTQMVAVGPTEVEDQEAHDAGRWYSAGAVLLHEECSGLLSTSELETLVGELTIADPTAPREQQ